MIDTLVHAAGITLAVVGAMKFVRWLFVPVHPRDEYVEIDKRAYRH